MSVKNPKDLVVDESGYMNDAMKKMAEKIFAEEKKQTTVTQVNNNRVITVNRSK